MTADAGVGADAGSAGTGSLQGAPKLRGSLCDVDGWCWESPVPQGNRLIAVAAASPDEIWFGGSSGTLFRWAPSGFEGTIGELTRDEITALYARAGGRLGRDPVGRVPFDGRR